MSLTKITAFFLDGPWENSWHTVNFTGPVKQYRLAHLPVSADMNLIKPDGSPNWRYCDYYFFRYPYDMAASDKQGFFKFIWIAASDPDAYSWLWHDEDARAAIVLTMSNMSDPQLVMYEENSTEFPKGLDEMMSKAAELIGKSFAAEMEKLGETLKIVTDAMETNYKQMFSIPSPAVIADAKTHINLTGI